MAVRPTVKNRERIADFEVEWDSSPPARPVAFTAVLRVKNEARSLPWVLPSLLNTVADVIVVDNESDDGTREVAQDVARRLRSEQKLTLLNYPFSVARCGEEHLHTPPDSVHSLTYYYNWSFSQVRTPYVLKWDGDIFMTGQGERILGDLPWLLEGYEAVVAIPRLSLYVQSEKRGYVDVATRNQEPWAWPNKPEYYIGKGVEWEIPIFPRGVPIITLPQICYELKWLDEDEFDHWSDQSFETSRRTSRKQREWDVFQSLNAGVVPSGVEQVDAPEGQHVIDYVRDRWRPSLPS